MKNKIENFYKEFEGYHININTETCVCELLEQYDDNTKFFLLDFNLKTKHVFISRFILQRFYNSNVYVFENGGEQLKMIKEAMKYTFNFKGKVKTWGDKEP